MKSMYEVSSYTDTILLAMWNADTKADTCGFSAHPAAKRCSIFAILLIRTLITRGGSSTEK